MLKFDKTSSIFGKKKSLCVLIVSKNVRCEMAISIQSVNSTTSQQAFGNRRTSKRSTLKYYGSIAVGGGAAGALVGGIQVLCDKSHYPTVGSKLGVIGKEAAILAGMAVVFNGAINLFNKLVND